MNTPIKAQLIFILLNTFIFSNLHALDIETSKVFDGTLAHCSNANDHFKNQDGVYRFEALSASIKDSSYLEIPYKLTFLKCAKIGQEYQMITSLPYESYEYTFLKTHVYNEVKEVRVKAYRDGIYDVLLDEVVSNGRSLLLNFESDIENLITNEEKIRLEDNEEIAIAVDFFITKTVRTTTDSGNIFLRNMSYGSFRVHVKIEKTFNSFKVSYLK